MKSTIKPALQCLSILILTASPTWVLAQPGPGGLGGMGSGGPEFSATFGKLFGEHRAFSAKMLMEMTNRTDGDAFSTPCQIVFLDGKSRMEIDLTRSKGAKIPPGMGEQLKAMGMAELAVISQPSAGVAYMVYPALKAYAKMSAPDGKPVDETKFKVDITELGKETVDGHACVKNKAVVTEPDGKTHQATLWNAVDLKKFPVRIVTGEGNATVTIRFEEVKLAKPDAKLLEPPADYTAYDNMQAMMQETVMKRMLGGQQNQ